VRANFIDRRGLNAAGLALQLGSWAAASRISHNRCATVHAMAGDRDTITKLFRRNMFDSDPDQCEQRSISRTPRAAHAIVSGRPLTASRSKLRLGRGWKALIGFGLVFVAMTILGLLGGAAARGSMS